MVDRLEPVPDVVNPERLEPANDAVETLRTTLYYAPTADGFETAIVNAVNRGGDADTIGAITGAVAGARFIVSDIPTRWISDLQHRAELTQLADQLVTLS